MDVKKFKVNIEQEIRIWGAENEAFFFRLVRAENTKWMTVLPAKNYSTFFKSYESETSNDEGTSYKKFYAIKSGPGGVAEELT